MSEQSINPETDIVSENFIDFTVHSVRIIIKLGIIMALYIGQNTHLLPLTLYVAATEIIDQSGLFLFRKYEKLRPWIRLLYSVNSVTLLSVIAYFANWVLTDFYLIYLIHISSAMFTYH